MITETVRPLKQAATGKAKAVNDLVRRSFYLDWKLFLAHACTRFAEALLGAVLVAWALFMAMPTVGSPLSATWRAVMSLQAWAVLFGSLGSIQFWASVRDNRRLRQLCAFISFGFWGFVWSLFLLSARGGAPYPGTTVIPVYIFASLISYLQTSASIRRRKAG